MQIAQVKEVLADLVRFRTVSSESNLPCIDYIREFLERHGATCWIQYDQSSQKANLLATVGPARPGGILLSGHTDVVPVDGQVWRPDPWQTVEIGDRIYGRGTTDMKGFLALMMVTAASAANSALSRPIHFAFSYDEELGCLGAWPMSLLIKEKLTHLPPILVGEPTRNRVVSNHKGITTFATTVKGYSVHSSRVHRGVSAVTECARLIAWLDDRMRLSAQTPASECFDPPFTVVWCTEVTRLTSSQLNAPSQRM